MKLESLVYGFAYRLGRPRWDSDNPRAELRELAGAGGGRRALDLGCGTGTNAVYLAEQGWDVVGIDFTRAAIAAATERARRAGSTATFIVGDVTRLGEIGVRGPFDLMVDIGCYHALSADRRDSYAAEVAAVARPGADFYLAGISRPPLTWRMMGAKGVTAEELRKRLSAHFELKEELPIGRVGRASPFIRYHLVRTG